MRNQDWSEIIQEMFSRKLDKFKIDNRRYEYLPTADTLINDRQFFNFVQGIQVADPKMNIPESAPVEQKNLVWRSFLSLSLQLYRDM